MSLLTKVKNLFKKPEPFKKCKDCDNKKMNMFLVCPLCLVKEMNVEQILQFLKTEGGYITLHEGNQLVAQILYRFNEKIKELSKDK